MIKTQIIPSEVSTTNVNNDPELRKLLIHCYLKTDLYAKTFYENRFSLDFAPLHQEIFDVIDAKTPEGLPLYQKIVIKAPRGIGKSSIAKTLAAKRLRYRDCHYLVYIGKTFDFACLQTENIKNGMLQNKKEKEVFGTVKMSKTSKEFSETFSKKSWITSHGGMVFPRGANQPVRGLLFDYDGFSYRPDCYIIDDLEDKKEIMNDEFRKELELWFFSDVVKSVPLPGVSMNWQIIYIDTLKHEDSLLQKLIDNPEWKALELTICEDDFISLAPEFISDADIQAELREAELNPLLLDVFYQERMGRSISTKNRTFKQKYFKKYSEHDNDFQRELYLGEIRTVILHDPAKTVNPQNADTAIAAIGVNVLRRKIYIREVAFGKWHPEEQYEVATNLIKKYGAILLGVEENSLHEFIIYPFQTYLSTHKVDIEWMNLKPRKGASRGTGKIEKIGGLISFYETGMILHEENLLKEKDAKAGDNILESQLLAYPRGKLVDVADVVSYIIQVLSNFFVYFDTLPADDIESAYQDEQDQEEENYLETIEDFPDDWRLAEGL